MISTVQLSNKAIELRRLGHSYSDISKQLKVSKTSVSNWVKNVRLTEAEKNVLERNLKLKKDRAKMKLSISLRARKVFKEKKAYENAEKDFAKLHKDPLFMLGLGLYWSHGSKIGGSFQFMSADPVMIKIILRWIEKYLSISREMPKYRLFVDIRAKGQGFEEYWSKTAVIPLSNFQKTVITRSQTSKRSPEYKGSLAVTLSSIEVIRKIIAWQKLVIRYYS